MNYPVARAIIVKDGKIAVHKRVYKGFRYTSFPGGHIEEGEEPSVAVAREVMEELTLRVKVGDLAYKYESNDWPNQLFFLCEYQSGEISLSPESNEAADNKIGENTYQPIWLDVKEINNVNLLPKAVAVRLSQDLAAGKFASEPVTLYD